uniref:Mos1 transposase HTH domain-containing protein n=1 Tax=Globodera rostochiensis TaxID=31243 RepID=A0A914HPD3_GLORO
MEPQVDKNEHFRHLFLFDFTKGATNERTAQRWFVQFREGVFRAKQDVINVVIRWAAEVQKINPRWYSNHIFPFRVPIRPSTRERHVINVVIRWAAEVQKINPRWDSNPHLPFPWAALTIELRRHPFKCGDPMGGGGAKDQPAVGLEPTSSLSVGSSNH